MVPKVMIILGSGSDIDIAKKSIDILEKLEIPYSLKVASAHRTHSLVKALVKEATEAGFVNLKGHRTVGGMRASIYNAMPKEGVEKLVEFMKEFEAKNS